MTRRFSSDEQRKAAFANMGDIPCDTKIIREHDEYERNYKYYPLYHGIRTRKTPEQIKKYGFSTFGTSVDMKKEIMIALKYFGKEKLATVESGKGYLVQSMLRESTSKQRKNVWATTYRDSVMKWWGSANPESISLLLQQIGIPPDRIDKYLSERFGDDCYIIKLKITSLGQNQNFNTGLDYIPSNLIESVEEMKDCRYTGREKVI